MSKRKNELRKGKRRNIDYGTNASLGRHGINRELNSCVRKQSYQFIYDAYEAAFGLIAKFNTAYSVYCCEFCGAYHIGSARLPDGTPFRVSNIVFFNGSNSNPILVDRTSKPVAWAVESDDGRIRMFHSSEKELSQWRPKHKANG